MQKLILTDSMTQNNIGWKKERECVRIISEIKWMSESVVRSSL